MPMRMGVLVDACQINAGLLLNGMRANPWGPDCLCLLELIKLTGRMNFGTAASSAWRDFRTTAWSACYHAAMSSMPSASPPGS
jgi:hypothetical protein